MYSDAYIHSISYIVYLKTPAQLSTRTHVLKYVSPSLLQTQAYTHKSTKYK